MDHTTPPIYGAVEGATDRSVLERLITHIGAQSGTIYVKNGKQNLVPQVKGYNYAARQTHFVVLIDLDHDALCAGEYIQSLLPEPAKYMCCRIIVRAVEAWLLADRERVAEYFSVPLTRIPLNPETLERPKRAFVDVAHHSRQGAIREDMVPREGSGIEVGPAYSSRLIEFVRDEKNGWRPEVASESARSLQKCLARLQQLRDLK